MKILIEFTPYDECADESDDTGLTEAAFIELTDKLMGLGEIGEVRKVEP